MVNAVPEIDLVVWIAPLSSIKPKDHRLPSIKEEIEKWGGFNCQNIIYKGIETIQSSDRAYLEIYNALQSSVTPFIIVDESIKIKNFDAKRTKRVLEFGKMAEYKLILNGEPITKDLLDIWAQFNFLDPEILNMSLAEFKNTFCKYTTVTKRFSGFKEYSKTFITGYENIDYLYSLIGEYVFECDLELNVKQIFETEKYELSEEEKESYNFIKENYLDNEKLLMMNNNIFLEMTQKMQHGYCCSKKKFEIVSNWITDESKTIIFTKYIASAEECKKRFPKSTVLNYKTGSLSLNLQELPNTVYFDGTFDWGDVIQSQHRNYRTGQENDCRYLKLIGNVGLESLIEKNNEKKIGISEYLKKISKEQLKEIL
ncbi:SNF2-related protein [Chryseobacterium aquaticum]|uniref:SNF2-related protein n=1 Tax=Chryseobacterium aquaticum TaxID=452084 RepID=UPI001E4564E8|nr:SNF2-related protein [Chryseobacterium aquaticum]